MDAEVSEALREQMTARLGISVHIDTEIAAFGVEEGRAFIALGDDTHLNAECLLYAEGRVAHFGTFPELERQMFDFGADGLSEGKSPDRLDALVWALTDLLLTRHRVPTVRRI